MSNLGVAQVVAVEWQQGHMTRPLDRLCYRTLLLGRDACLPPRANFAPVGHEVSQRFVVFVVNFGYL
jgi:hypothetical protein